MSMGSLALFDVSRWDPVVIFFVILNLYFLLVYALVKSGWLQRLGMSLFGPALMIKTQRGRGLLDFFARAPRFFDRAAGVGTALIFVVMALMTLLLILQLGFIFRLRPEEAPSARLILGIPGINPIIPLGYGLVALVVAVVVHELSHGILARVYHLRVKTMGLLLLVVPIGAFVEPDEDDLKAAPRRHRIRVFGAGPTANLAFALLFAVLFSPLLMASAQPVAGASILGVESPGPACTAGLLPGWVVTHANGEPRRQGAVEIPDRTTLVNLLNASRPGQTLYLFVRDATVPSQLEERFRPCINETHLQTGVFPVIPRTCQDQYGPEACQASGAATHHPDPLNRTVIGINLYPVDQVHRLLVNPLASPRAFLYYISLPFFALTQEFPLAGPFEHFYETPFTASVYWPLANTFYWLFWINLMLALTNALPMVPLDGGYMFRDFLGGWIQRHWPRVPQERRDAVARRISLGVAFFLLSLVVLQFVGPHLAGWFR